MPSLGYELPRTFFLRTSVNNGQRHALVPSRHGRQAGKASSAGLSVSRVRPDPSEFMT